MHTVLHAMRQRPGLYFGGPELPFTRLEAFIAGFNIGWVAASTPTMHPSREDFCPDRFNEFVAKDFLQLHSDGGKGWQSLIREHTSTEEDAFALFFSLLEKYEESLKNG